MTSLRAAVESAVRATDVDGYRLMWHGRPVAAVPPEVMRRIDVAALRSHQAATLTRLLYAAIYRPSVGRIAMNTTPALQGESSSLVAALSAANRGRGRWQTGGVVVSTGASTIIRYRDIEVRCRDSDVRAIGSGRLRAGDTVQVFRPAESVLVNPGFYTATSEPPDGPGAQPRRVRFYWNVHPGAAPRLVGDITGALLEAGVAYTLKLPVDSTGYDRPDAAVLYVGDEDAMAVRALLPGLWCALRHGLHPDVPALTLRLADGLAFAEQPDGGASFGMHRMGLLADAIVAVVATGVSSRSRRIALVLDRLVASGIDPARPYLNPGSNVAIRPFSPHERGIRGGRAAGTIAEEEAPDLVAVAGAMGRRLSAAAVRWDGRCTWLGPERTADGSPGRALRTLGPLLHDGIAGIALALAEIGAHADDGGLHTAADGAMRHALDLAAALDPPSIGLHAGRAGIAVAGLRVGTLLDHPEHAERAVALLRAVAPSGSEEPDLLAGVAGLCLGLLIAGRATGDAALLAGAVACGERLLEAADRSACGWSWTSPSAPPGRTRNLCGLSHGAAGIALALGELAVETGESVWREAASAAHDYERNWFDSSEANWPDFRDPAKRPSSGFMVAWCHGAGGIVLERLHTAALLDDARARDDARAGVASLRSWIEGARGRPIDFSLCHGVAGNAEALATAGGRFGDARDVELAHRALSAGAQRYERAGIPWPGGHRAGTTPSLMLGDAGIALALLRSRVPSIPSVLLPVPARDSALIRSRT